MNAGTAPQSPARSVTMQARSFSIVLPGTWAQIPLEQPEESERAIASLVKRQVGRDDRLARTRRESKEQLRSVADRARAAGAFRLAMSMEILPGIPFPAAMILKNAAWPVAAGSASPEERLAAAFPAATIVRLDAGPAARTWSAVTRKPGTEPIPTVKLEYFLVPPRGEQLLQIAVDVPTEVDPELIVALIDAIVDSIRWFADDTTRFLPSYPGAETPGATADV